MFARGGASVDRHGFRSFSRKIMPIPKMTRPIPRKTFPQKEHISYRSIAHFLEVQVDRDEGFGWYGGRELLQVAEGADEFPPLKPSCGSGSEATKACFVVAQL